jgi:hypothetical protein
MAYNIAGIDVHKKKLAVVVADVEVEEAYQFERRWYGSNPEQLQLLAKWLIEQQVEEVGAKAATFASTKHLVSWVGACPGEEESAGVNRSKRSPKGNRQMRRILFQAANAAVKHKGSIFEIVYRRLVLRLGQNKTIGAIAHRLCRLIWIILKNGERRSLSGTRPHSM